MADIIVTWPMGRPLESYLGVCEAARKRGEVICYGLSATPTDVQRGDRCYHVHRGAVRGWFEMIDCQVASPHRTVVNPVTGAEMTAGTWLIRDPEWHPITEPVPFNGFRGFRYSKNVQSRLWVEFLVGAGRPHH